MGDENTRIEITIGDRRVELRGREATAVAVLAVIAFALISYSVVNWLVS